MAKSKDGRNIKKHQVKDHPDGSSAQLDLDIRREPERDRNFSKGGRSFYFFDFDENVAFLGTPIFLFHRESGQQQMLSSQEFTQIHQDVGRRGIYKDYAVEFCDRSGSFRNFRDKNLNLLEKVLGRKQFFVQDLAEALASPDYQWKGPSWSCFYHAVFNRRPLSVITARGHSPQTIKQGVELLVKGGHLPHSPNYLNLFPVSHPDVRAGLSGNDSNLSIAELKRRAIHRSFQDAIDRYGYSPHHRFGMSDDDPKNIELAIEAMTELKESHAEISFFVISTHKGQFVKHEVFPDHTEDEYVSAEQQLRLF